MKLTVFGPTGRIGQQLVAQALAAGHDVTAVVRATSAPVPGARTVTVDLADHDPALLAPAVAGADAVLSALGPRRRAEHGIVSAGTRRIVAAMQATGARRLVVVSGVGVATVPVPGRPRPPRREPGTGFRMQYVTVPLIRRVLGGHFVDVALMEHDLERCDLDWTIMRVPRVTDEPPTGRVRTAYDRPLRAALRIGRADAAALMLHLATRSDLARTVVTAAS
ncbi:NAD(P)-dependent oxidoreductase [Cellulomonas telluris]|uniref:NAD(P)-dependent oxidoreductase n=1 Tax=Cellulomonas telluris TaxID=2306636 RepID=UPI0010A94D8F|nr:NAD(P)H-binding protein [Cellulomonas telluris]